MSQQFLVTAALPYSNGRLHVGHIAGAYLPADTYVRYLRAQGKDVRFICGSDDNGVTALIAARKEGIPVEQLTAHYNTLQRDHFAQLGIQFDVYGGTHQPDFVKLHTRISQEIFRAIHDKGYFEKRETLQLYDSSAGQFLPDRYVRGTCYHHRADGTVCGYPEAYGDQCEFCGNAIDPLKLVNPVSTITGTVPEPRKTTHWYLQLSQFEGKLRDWLESKRKATDSSPAWREFVLNYALGQVKDGLPERAMTRDLEWGVPVPLQDPDAEGKVLYVWFDAPIGYVSFTARLCEDRDNGCQKYVEWWKNPDCRIVHFVGEDNTIFHTLTWPAMLMAEGTFQLPWQVVVNAFLNIKAADDQEQKLSKSRGTAVWVEDYLKDFDPDPLRYYLTAIAPESQRTAFSLADLAVRNNAELLGALGNFIHRTLTFATRYFESRVPLVGKRNAKDLEHASLIETQVGRVTAHLDRFEFKAALAEVMALARAANKYFDSKQPWKQRREDAEACGSTVNVCLQTVKALTVLMAPFLPFSAARCATMLGLEDAPGALAWKEATQALPEGHALNEPSPLFRKLDTEGK